MPNRPLRWMLLTDWLLWTIEYHWHSFGGPLCGRFQLGIGFKCLRCLNIPAKVYNWPSLSPPYASFLLKDASYHYFEQAWFISCSRSSIQLCLMSYRAAVVQGRTPHPPPLLPPFYNPSLPYSSFRSALAAESSLSRAHCEQLCGLLAGRRPICKGLAAAGWPTKEGRGLASKESD